MPHITWLCPCNATQALCSLFSQHPFIADVVDNKPLKELYNEAKAIVIEELEDLPEDTKVLFVCDCFSFNTSWNRRPALLHSTSCIA